MTWWQNVINFQSTLVAWAFKLNICFSLSYIFSYSHSFIFNCFFLYDWTSFSIFIEYEMQLSLKCPRIRLSFLSMVFLGLFLVFLIIFISNELIIAIKPLQVSQKATWFLVLFILICIIKCAPHFVMSNVIHSPFQFYSNRTGCLLNAIKI